MIPPISSSFSHPAYQTAPVRHTSEETKEDQLCRGFSDAKIHQMVVDSGMLSRLGIVIAIASTVGYFVVSTHFAWGIAVGLTMAVAAQFFAEEPAPAVAEPPKEKKTSPVHFGGGGGGSPRLPPYVEGQPIGIRRDGTMNCWAISLFQFLRHAPALSAALQEDEFFGAAFADYTAGQTARARVGKLDSQTIRNWFAERWRSDISQDAAVQQDAHEALVLLTGRFAPSIPMLYQRPANSDANTEIQTNNLHTISLAGHRSMTLEVLIGRNYMQGENDTEGYFIRRFQTPPPYLALHFDRFGGDWQRSEKINDTVAITPRLQFPGVWAVSEEAATYTCTAFIKHIGRSTHGGHYVAYVFSQDQWWLCDDHSVTPVSTSEAEKELGNCYIAYFDKT